MNSKMFASLEEAMKKWMNKCIETQEYQSLDFHCPANIELRMAEAAKTVFDMAVEASTEAEENSK